MIPELYETLTKSEKFGLQFGLFPYDKCKGITREDSKDLLTYAKQQEYK